MSTSYFIGDEIHANVESYICDIFLILWSFTLVVEVVHVANQIVDGLRIILNLGVFFFAEGDDALSTLLEEDQHP